MTANAAEDAITVDDRDVTAHREPASVAGATEQAESAEAIAREPNPIKRFLKIVGPGLITGAADDDPSAVGTYALAGAAFGYQTLWTAPVTLPMMAAVVYICGKIGMVSGRGLSGVLRRHYPKWVLVPALSAFVVANTLNTAADLGAIAAGISLLVPLPAPPLVIPVALVLLVAQIWGSYRTLERVLKCLTLALFAYVISSVMARPDWGAVLNGTLVPTFRADPAYISILVAILGTTISPYMYFWQAGQQVEEEIALGRRKLVHRKGATDTELRHLTIDVNAGIGFSNVVMYFIILAAASTLHKAGQTQIGSAAEAAQALQPLAGDAAGALFAIGFMGVGLLTVPVLTTGAAYAVAEALGWRVGLHEKPYRAKGFYAIIAAVMLAGVLLNFAGINVMDALVWAAVLNGLLLPPLLVLILLVANNRTVMGDHVNGLPLNLLGWTTVAAGVAAAAGLGWTWLAS
jgi:NRAMP (natural resistance-associated macrophage protein)-like metal ion transporter